MRTLVVIPHYIVNEEVLYLAENAIQSFRDTSDAIIVSVDDGSPLKHNLKQLSDVLITQENGGFAKAMNAGFRFALSQGDSYVVAANNDIEVYPGWLDVFQELLFVHNGDMVGGLGYKEREIQGVPLKDYTPSKNYISFGGRLEDWMFPGGFYMTTTSFLSEVGLYDENYEHGGIEDIDLFYRAKLAGKRLIITPKVIYWHKEGATRYSDSEKDKQSVAIRKNEAYFERKWGFHPVKELNSKILLDERFNP